MKILDPPVQLDDREIEHGIRAVRCLKFVAAFNVSRVVPPESREILNSSDRKKECSDFIPVVHQVLASQVDPLRE